MKNYFKGNKKEVNITQLLNKAKTLKYTNYNAFQSFYVSQLSKMELLFLLKLKLIKITM
jgi:hypothetical protein